MKNDLKTVIFYFGILIIMGVGIGLAIVFAIVIPLYVMMLLGGK